ncbi:hypothetical protein EDC04DRAFT_2603676 [Pisolithus marmoratus]|nr:hypothetical protein EDC04DRAFT_2603676 [Pisolithus marmoratus]
MVIHLRNCERQPEDVHRQAEQQGVDQGWIQASSMFMQTPQVAPQPVQHPIISVHIPEHPGNVQSSQSPLTPLLPPPQVPPLGNPSSSLLSPVIDPTLLSSTVPGTLHSPAPSPGISPIPISIFLPSTTTSCSGTPTVETLALPTALKHHHLSSQCLPSGTPPPASGMVLQWSSTHQECSEHHIANITASCGFPFNWVENQAVRDFLDDLLPYASHLSSYQLTNCIVPQQVNHYHQAAKDASKGCQGTLQTDGWTGINFHHLVAFMVTTVKQKMLLLNEGLLDHLKVLVKEINLVVGDYFKVSQVQLFLTTTKKAAYHQLLDLLYALQILARHEKDREIGGSEKCIIIGDAASHRKAKEMLAVIEDSLFWHTLAKPHIVGWDEVLIMFGFLTLKYEELLEASSGEDSIIVSAIMDSLEKHWSKSSGDYEGMETWVQATIQMSVTNHQCPDPIQMYESVTFPDQDPSPLQKLAHHIFSICANSASCECLFSRFGLILTHLHSQLGLKNLLNLAELSLHLRDEYSQSGRAIERLLSPQSTQSGAANSSEESHSDDYENQILSSSGAESEDPESFNAIVNTLGQWSHIDDENDVDFTSPFEKEALSSFFNFQDKSWVEMTERISLRSLDEELELYELIELDAEGEDDEQEFDSMMSSTV